MAQMQAKLYGFVFIKFGFYSCCLETVSIPIVQ